MVTLMSYEVVTKNNSWKAQRDSLNVHFQE